jgi:microcystin degradation protein MlrC
MSEQLDKLWHKADATDIEACILWVADDNTPSALELAEKALVELAALREAVEALKVYAARENWWITDGDAIWQEGSADTEPWLIADAALAKLEGAK